MISYNPHDVFIVQRTADSSSFQEVVLSSSPMSYVAFDSSSKLVSISRSIATVETSSYSNYSKSSISSSWASSSLSASYAPAPENVIINTGTGTNSIGIGLNSSALDDASIAIGSNAVAISAGGISIGSNASTSDGSIAIGNESAATGLDAVALGSQTYALNWDSTAIGAGAVSNHTTSVALGALTQTTKNSQIRLGRSQETVSIPGKLEIEGHISASVITASLFCGNVRSTAYKTVSENYTVDILDSIIYGSASNANIILTLPTASSVRGQLFHIKKIDLTGYEIIITSSVNIDYDKELRLSQSSSMVNLHSDAVQYWIH